MIRRILAALGLALAFVATSASAQLSTYTFGTLPSSPSAGQLAWITDNAGTPTVGSPASGGASAGNRDLVAYNGTNARWEFVSRVPSSQPAPAPTPAIDSTLTGYTSTNAGVLDLALANVRGALDWLIESIGTEKVCSTELIKGVGYNPATKRFRKTCADYNWPGWRDATQATASYQITCTGEGAPHASCLRSGDVVYKGYWMRLALAAQYTREGGEVITQPHTYELDGCGLLQDGVTRAKCPLPYDPEWEARPEFAQLGYPTALMGIVVNRGVRIVGADAPEVLEASPVDATVGANDPKYAGSWIIDNYGPTSGGGGGTPINDGPNSNMTAPNYRTVIGWNQAVEYCSTTSNTNPACNREASNSQAFKIPGSNEYGYASPIQGNITDAASVVCVNDTIAGTTSATFTGTCRGNRKVLCGDTSGVAAGRNVYGCIFDTDSDGDFTAGDSGNLNLGVCESFADALQYDRQTRKQDIQVALQLPQCADDASSSTDCASTDSVGIIGWNTVVADIATPIGSWTGPQGLSGSACGSGGAYIEVAAVSPAGGAFASVMPRRAVYAGSGVPAMLAVAVRRDKIDLRNAGISRMGFAPSSWLGRTSTGLGTCTSGGDVSTSNDEQACDTETQLAFSGGYNGLASENLFFHASHAANKSGIVETEAGSGGPNYFLRNRIRDAIRVNGISDWGEGLFAWNHISGVNRYGGAYPAMACYSDGCRIEDNLFEDVKAAYAFGSFANANNVWFARNRWRHVSISNLQAFYWLWSVGRITIEDEEYSSVWSAGSPLLRMTVGQGTKQKPAVVFRRNHGVTQLAGSAGYSPTTIVLVENSSNQTTRTDEYKSLLVSENDLTTSESNPCLVTIEDDTSGDSAALTQESADRVLVLNNILNGAGTPDAVCVTGYRATPGTLFTAANDRGPSAENNYPTVMGNILNNVRALDVPHPWKTVANVPDADTLAEGTKVKVSNGTASCGHTSGVLTSGSVRISCTAHPNGSGDDGTWTAD